MRNRKTKKKLHIDESWLLPYADLLTLLLALFIVLFAMSEVDVKKYKELSEVFKSEFSSSGDGILESKDMNVESPEDDMLEEPDSLDVPDKKESEEEDSEKIYAESLENLKQVQADINQYIHEQGLSDVLGTKLTDEGLLITISNDVTFDSGSAIVKSGGEDIAHAIAKLLNNDPPLQVIVSGHADDRPMHNHEFASNWELSVARAVNFMSLVLNNDKLDPTKFSAKGYGEFQPIVPNTSEENRRKNRRVEVLVLPRYQLDTDT
ncbi:flagellar motor protein MotB [Ornithinibacillus gellani]|uniref:flagellar motor protein MotB n=1 Tax=Ornithinibacillus gellani TaxID=2293253 RepID=UPI000F461B80|nr:flagellar motor protein MotB [Ornithinibacillus gellani]TQS74971.1 flagellar motor protein MotB [Ornithinibacillus gellani]